VSGGADFSNGPSPRPEKSGYPTVGGVKLDERWIAEGVALDTGGITYRPE